MKFKLIASFIVSFFMFLAGCNSESISSQTPQSTEKPISTNSPTSTQTFVPTPSRTLLPGDLTQAHFMFTAIPATLEARNVKCKDGFSLDLWNEVTRMSNDEWTIFTCSPILKNEQDWRTPGTIDFGTRYTQIVKTDLSQTWTIQHSAFDYSVIDRPDAFLAPFRWTADGQYLYFYPQSYPGPSGGNELSSFMTHINDLYRINLETGKFELVLLTDQFDAMSLSPNNQYLAYSNWDEPDIIHIINVEKNEESQVKLNEDIIGSGDFIWNSEGTRVVFIGAHGTKNLRADGYGGYDVDVSSTSIFILTIKNMHAQKILSKDSRVFTISSGCNNWESFWLDENTLCLYSINYDFDSWNKFFTFNIKTGAVEFLREWGEQSPTLTPKP